ncbi:MAG: hypothetical protein N2Z40_05225 [Caldimicrobium sp.]|nr:hypothetical protein [Caldimicrobium sp.]MCX7613603.1 hypothetical protein [Caldimicrobium sp.]MDW8183082.1 hypothetical protein [Caldimicrobium sp.]
MPKDLFLYALLILDLIILGFLITLYLKFRKIVSFPWEDIEASLERAQVLVTKLQELRSSTVNESHSTEDIMRDQVYALHKNGMGPKEIAKRLGISEGEVEILLKRKKLP